ncbi:uncharacterized protein SPPG_07649 [Spizellomyces punctatus DAOM BR117]|uniref:G-protein coupled receptors family 3 profile domain-containing protein n=1 Tax=Spizellomyces punctatus (strain DAOM BR117) TaxID=645134 RepID=A0A0L0H6X1_SPIPD|nr:uncharacterized protein SPPG_07649 [Spizellomyces punctatus DAOM BR117]KNC97260.1 hypothetical protein SPPG_07649 [Spizellomyces punctatus DAOM BR117]|eukprot:XP_016605300.1 hypothetical protein SPPG_07649 [Spizellomyces punctatus DAOM BR117]
MPVCDGSSANAGLSSRNDYPNFFRTIPNDNLAAEATINLVLNTSWTRLGFIAPTDNMGTGLLTRAIEYAKFMKVDIATVQTFYPDNDDFSLLVSKVIESAATVLVYFGAPEGLTGILKEAEKRGMVSTDYQWIAYSDPSLIHAMDPNNPDAGGLEPAELRLWHGVWQPYPREASGDIYKNTFLPAWQMEYANGDMSASPTSYAMFFAGCLEMMVYGFDKLLKSNTVTFSDLADIHTSGFRFTVPEDFSFPEKQGVTGSLALDEYGDRLAAMDILYYDYGTDSWIPFGTWDKAGEKATYVTRYAEPVYFNGGTMRPSDVLQVTTLLTTVDVHDGMGTFTIVLCAIAVLAILLVMVILANEWSNPIFKANSPPILATTLIGILTGTFYPVTLLGEPSQAACVAAAWLIPCGLGLVLGSLLVKTFRLFAIFRRQGARKIGTTNKHMFSWLATVAGIYVVIVLVWTIVDPPRPQKEVYNIISPSLVESRAFCASSTGPRQWAVQGILFGYTVLLLIAGGFMAFATRNLPKQFSESKSLGYVLYAYSGIMIFVLPILFLLDISYSGYLIIKVIATYAAVFLTLGILFGNKLFQLWQSRQANRSNNDLLRSGIRKKKDPTTDSWAVNSVSKTATKYGKVWVSDRQSMVSFWAERTLIVYADKAIALLAGGAKKHAATTCRYFPLLTYEFSTQVEESEGIYTLRLRHSTDPASSVTVRVPSAQELEEWATLIAKLCRRTSDVIPNSRANRPASSNPGSVTNQSEKSNKVIPKVHGPGSLSRISGFAENGKAAKSTLDDSEV